MERLTRKSQISDMVWFIDHENNNMDLEPCEMNPHHNRLVIHKLAEYEDLEEQCIKENAIGIKLLIKKWKDFLEDMHELVEYRKLKDQGRLLILPCAVGDVVDKLFSHNELIALWTLEKGFVNYHEKVWEGMAWNIPKEYKECKFVKIFGTIPESIGQADIINVEVVLSEEAEAALEKMKGE